MNFTSLQLYEVKCKNVLSSRKLHLFIFICFLFLFISLGLYLSDTNNNIYYHLLIVSASILSLFFGILFLIFILFGLICCVFLIKNIT